MVKSDILLLLTDAMKLSVIQMSNVKASNVMEVYVFNATILKDVQTIPAPKILNAFLNLV